MAFERELALLEIHPPGLPGNKKRIVVTKRNIIIKLVNQYQPLIVHDESILLLQ